MFRENWKTLLVFMDMAGQWRWTGGMESRRDGLEYGSLPLVYEAHGIGKKKRVAVFRGLQVMERSALNVWRQAEK
ncbi:hypothetical protein AAKU55_003140 [Oxalobacteraceae bacterium GrIS 1.11]